MKMKMKKIFSFLIALFITVAIYSMFLSNLDSVFADVCTTANASQYPTCTTIDTDQLGFQIPSLGDILTFAIRVFFIIAGLAALFYMLIGAFSWIQSGGDEEAVTGARNKIQAAVFGMILIVGVLAIIWTLEQVIFNRRICLGLSCTLTLPSLVKVDTNLPVQCCTCVDESGTRATKVINTNDPDQSCY
jgi:hypothetical protein